MILNYPDDYESWHHFCEGNGLTGIRCAHDGIVDRKGPTF